MSEPVLNVSWMFGFGSGLPGAIWMYSERRPDVQCLLGTVDVSGNNNVLTTGAFHADEQLVLMSHDPIHFHWH